ncbi:MAG: hypothetical protein M0R39_12350 [Prolixibacteraceae bacterium]|nr:hypothetical protein [Prolixibacteraceae bacterium]
MKKEDLITSISILLNQPTLDEKDIQYFDKKNHDELVEELKQYLIKNSEFLGEPQLEFMQGMNDHGVDLLLKSHDNIKVGFQIKSHFDVSQDTFAGKLKSQITESSFHSINKLYILFCSPFESGKDKYKARISHILSELSGFKTNYHCAYSPVSCIGIFLNNKKVDNEYFFSTFKKYSIDKVDKTEIINEIAPEDSKPSFLSRLKQENSTDFSSANSFVKFVKEQDFKLNKTKLLSELKIYCEQLKKIPKKSREFFVSVLKFAEPYGKLGNCINCVKSPFMDIIDSLGISKSEMLSRIKNLERLNLLSFDENDPYEHGQIVIGITGSNLDDDFNLSFEIREYLRNDIDRLKLFFIDLKYNELD